MDEVTYSKIEKLSVQGNLLADEQLYEEATIKFKEALDLVPSPKYQWEASAWLFSSIGDMFFLKNDFSTACEYFYNSLNCPGALDNAFINLRLGQCLFELGKIDKSKEYLLRTYMLEGDNIFNNEESKYFNSIKDLI